MASSAFSDDINNTLYELWKASRHIARGCETIFISLNEVAEWLDYADAENAEYLLFKYFTPGTDYRRIRVSTKINGRRVLKNLYFIDMICFQKFCMLSCTKRAKEIRCRFVLAQEADGMVVKTDDQCNPDVFSIEPVAQKAAAAAGLTNTPSRKQKRKRKRGGGRLTSILATSLDGCQHKKPRSQKRSANAMRRQLNPALITSY